MGQVASLTSRRWVRRSILVVLAFDLLVAGTVLGVRSRDEAPPFSADQAVAEFRTSTTVPSGTAEDVASTTATVPDPAAAPVTAPAPAAPAAVAAANETQDGPATTEPVAAPSSGEAPPGPDGGEQTPPPFPAEGVYVYETTGYEEVDALGGARHDYPPQTSIIHRRGGCGASETWQPFEDRRDVRQLCPEPGRHRLESFESSRSFFGRTDVRNLDCDDSATSFAAGAPPGSVFEFRCVDDRVEARNRLEVHGVEAITVGGVVVEAVRTRATSTVSGGSSGSSTIDSWVHPETGLTLKRISVLDGRSPGPGGSVSYHEEYTLVLLSLEPRR